MSGRLTALLGDERVTRRAAAGDRRAFEEIYRRYHQPLYQFCLAMVGDASDAQDALQNTMVKVLRALPGESREIALKPWLYRIARNEAVETLRRRSDRVEPEQEQIASPMEISETAADRERLRRLFADIRELPERQRGALVMRELSGLGFDEIARALQTSPTTARQTVYEARLGLRQMEAGREMRCEAVMKVLSDGDGRAASRRDLRAHLRHCPSCRAFWDGIAERQGQFAAIASLPLAASAYLLHGVLGQPASGAAWAGSGAGGAIGSAGGQAAAGTAVVKSAAAVAAAIAIGTAGADGAGLVDLPLSADGQPARHSQGPSDARSGSRTGGKAATNAAAQRNGRRADSNRSDGRGGSRAAAAGPGGASTGAGPGAKPGDRAQAPRTSRSPARAVAQSRTDPPTPRQAGAAGSHGSGHGGSAAGQKGPPEGLPEAAGHGQQTAAAHKPPQANGSPGPGSAGKGAPPSAPPAGGGPPRTPFPAGAARTAGAGTGRQRRATRSSLTRQGRTARRPARQRRRASLGSALPHSNIRPAGGLPHALRLTPTSLRRSSAAMSFWSAVLAYFGKVPAADAMVPCPTIVSPDSSTATCPGEAASNGSSSSTSSSE